MKLRPSFCATIHSHHCRRLLSSPTCRPSPGLSCSYKHWRGAYYGSGLPQRLEFEQHSKEFNMVSANCLWLGATCLAAEEMGRPPPAQ